MSGTFSIVTPEQNNTEDEAFEIERDNLARSLLYEDHEILDDMVIGPTVLLRPVHHNWLPASPTSLDGGSNHSGSHSSEIRSQNSEISAKDSKICTESSQEHFTENAKLSVHECEGKEQRFDCDICGKNFMYEWSLAKHTLSHKYENIFSGDSNDQLKYNVQKAGLYSCDICGMNYKLLPHLIKHTAAHHKTEKIFKDFQDFSKHTDAKIDTHELPTAKQKQNVDEAAPSPFLVDLRNKLSKLNTDLSDKTNHEERQTKPNSTINIQEEQPKTVETVNNKINSYNNQENGNNSYYYKPENLFECGICFKRFKTKITLDIHKKIHSTVKPYTCSICRKRFNQRSSLNRHQIVHHRKQKQRSSPKPENIFECDVCFKRYKTKTVLDVHKNIHSEVKPFTCDICQKGFNQISNLNQHNMNHHNKKKKKISHFCKFCNKYFKKITQLNVHVYKNHL